MSTCPLIAPSQRPRFMGRVEIPWHSQGVATHPLNRLGGGEGGRATPLESPLIIVLCCYNARAHRVMSQTQYTNCVSYLIPRPVFYDLEYTIVLSYQGDRIQVRDIRLRTNASCTAVFLSSLGRTSSSRILLYCHKVSECIIYPAEWRRQQWTQIASIL